MKLKSLCLLEFPLIWRLFDGGTQISVCTSFLNLTVVIRAPKGAFKTLLCKNACRKEKRWNKGTETRGEYRRWPAAWVHRQCRKAQSSHWWPLSNTNKKNTRHYSIACTAGKTTRGLAKQTRQVPIYVDKWVTHCVLNLSLIVTVLGIKTAA